MNRTEYHAARAAKKWTTFECPRCGIPRKMRSRDYRWRAKRNPTGLVFCGNSCAHEDNHNACLKIGDAWECRLSACGLTMERGAFIGQQRLLYGHEWYDWQERNTVYTQVLYDPALQQWYIRSAG